MESCTWTRTESGLHRQAVETARDFWMSLEDFSGYVQERRQNEDSHSVCCRILVGKLLSERGRWQEWRHDVSSSASFNNVWLTGKWKSLLELLRVSLCLSRIVSGHTKTQSISGDVVYSSRWLKGDLEVWHNSLSISNPCLSTRAGP